MNKTQIILIAGAIIKKLFFTWTIFVGVSCFAQIGIGTMSPCASAELDVFSETKGILIPRVTTDQMLNIPHKNALLVYNQTTGHFMYSLNNEWYILNPWKAKESKIYTNVEKVGIATSNPNATLDVNGMLRLVSQSGGDNSAVGTIYYNNGDDHLHINDGSWKEIPYDTDQDGIIDKKDPDKNNPNDFDITDDYIMAGKTYWANGTIHTGSMTPLDPTTLTIYPSSTDQHITQSGYYSSVYVQGDVNLLPENIRKGVRIFGVTGTLCNNTTYIWVVDLWGICHPIADNQFRRDPINKHCEDCNGNTVDDSFCSSIPPPQPVYCSSADEGQ